MKYADFCVICIPDNSETWSLTSTLEEELNAFHRKLLRISLDYIYPKKINNEKLYTLSKEIPLSQKIKKRRLNLFGHILRLDPETPVQKALEYYMTPPPAPSGKTTNNMAVSDHQRPQRNAKAQWNQNTSKQRFTKYTERLG